MNEKDYYYPHGGDIYANPVDYDFSVNINPLGMPLKSIAAAHEAIAVSGRYPDYGARKLRRAISDKTGVNPDKIVIGNGAAELIYAICHAVKPKRGLTAAPSFYEYEAAIRCAGGEVCYSFLKEEEDFELTGRFADDIGSDTDIVFLCNPNNPTGRLIDSGVIGAIIDKCGRTGAVLCIDESFLPFVRNNDKLTVMNKRKLLGDKKSGECSIIVIRSFTKIYGMAGLRLGYIVSNDTELLRRIRGNMQPWNTSAPAQMAGEAALSDSEFIEKTYDMLDMEKLYLYNGMEKVGIIKKNYRGAANFMLIYADAQLYDKLYRQGIMIRDCSDMAGLKEGYYRIGVRSHSENIVLLSALSRIKEG